MMNDIDYLSLTEYEAHSEFLQSVFNCQRRLPENVFRAKMAHHCFFEFDSMMAPDCWVLLSELANRYENDAIVVTVLDPDPVKYFHEAFGHSSAFKISGEATEDDYFAHLSHEPPRSPADAVLYNSRIVSWVPFEESSWAIWGERETGIAVLGALNDLSFLPSTIHSVSKQLAISLAIRNLRLNSEEATFFGATLSQNFPKY